MRRIVGFTLVFVGVFAVVLGVLLRAWAYPSLAKAPVKPETTSVAVGKDVTALLVLRENGVPNPQIRTGLNLTSTRFVTGDLRAPEVQEDGDIAAWVEATRVTDDDTGTVVSASVREVCLDRATNMGVTPCQNQYIEDQAEGQRDTDVQQPGLSLKFPFGTEQRDYPMYDVALRAPVDATFQGEEEIDGLAVYRFVQVIPRSKIGERDVPGALIGKSEPMVRADLYYENRRTMWVEPVTGQIIDGSEERKQELRTFDQPEGGGTLVFDGTLEFDDKTVTANVAAASDNKSSLWLLTTFPLILWIAGGAVLVVGVVLLALVRREGSGGGARRR
ncbi:DUF3068 domain-containing protein [Actinokineospora guangxiensis]|uniref:DUF3068 domain-containing protein n=1 Tax=Actinokineospora guangxiensis TaxID=1490288 RepID=A0ABW0EI11_9PSEU